MEGVNSTVISPLLVIVSPHESSVTTRGNLNSRGVSISSQEFAPPLETELRGLDINISNSPVMEDVHFPFGVVEPLGTYANVVNIPGVLLVSTLRNPNVTLPMEWAQAMQIKSGKGLRDPYCTGGEKYRS